MHARQTILMLASMLVLAGCGALSRPAVKVSGEIDRAFVPGRTGPYQLEAKVLKSAFIERPDGTIHYPSDSPVLVKVKGTIGQDSVNYTLFQIPSGVIPETSSGAGNGPLVMHAAVREPREFTSVLATGTMSGYYLSRGVVYLFHKNPVIVTDRVAANGFGTYMVVEATNDYERVFFLGPRDSSVVVSLLEDPSVSRTLETAYHFVELTFDRGNPVLSEPAPFHVDDPISQAVITAVKSAFNADGKAAIPPNWSDWLNGDLP